MDHIGMCFAAGFLVVFSIGFGSCTIAWTNPNSNNQLTPAVAETEPVGDLGITLTASFTDGASVASSNAYVIVAQETTGMFTLSGTYELQLATGYSFDYETKSSYVFTLKATDNAGATSTVTCTLSITDVNESPVFAETAYNAQLKSGSGAGTAVATVTATDPDSTATGNTITYSLTGGNTGDVFTVNSGTGAITIATSKSVSTSTATAYVLTLTGTSSGTGTPASTTTVNVGVYSSGAAIKTGSAFLTALLIGSMVIRIL